MFFLNIGETIINGIGFIIGLALFAYLWGLLQDWLSKATNTSFSRHGKVVSRPDYHDKNMKEIKEAKEHIIKKVSDARKIFSSLNTSSSLSEKLDALKKLGELKELGVISDEEFEILKSDILK